MVNLTCAPKTVYLSKHQSNLFVIIRSAGERTERLCEQIVRGQIGSKNVIVVRERPFEAALKTCYELGANTEVKWLVTLDADILLRDHAIIDLVSEAESLPPKAFQLSGAVLDKFTRQIRWASHRCYRTTFLRKALELLPSSNEQIRPESFVIERMAELGYASHRSTRVCGLHDFEQYLRDIYRKAFVHAAKHASWLPVLLPRWSNLCKTDTDFVVAVRGACDGISMHDFAELDPVKFIGLAQRALSDLQMTEKSSKFELTTSVSEQIDLAISSGQYQWLDRSDGSLSERLSARSKTLGPLRFAPYAVGSLLVAIGRKMQRWSDRPAGHRRNSSR